MVFDSDVGPNQSTFLVQVALQHTTNQPLTQPLTPSFDSRPFAAMSMHELRVYTLQRKVLNIDIQENRTVWKLRDHFPSDDPTGWKILKVGLLHNNL